MKPFLLVATRAEDDVADQEYEAFCRFGQLQPEHLVRLRLEQAPDLVAHGRFGLDGAVERGVPAARAGHISRAQAAQTMFQANYVTAVQFGMVLDLFQSEMSRWQVAQVGAARVVNPQHALGYADKFNANMNRTAYTQLMTQQLQIVQGGGVQQPPPYGRPPPPPPPGNPYPGNPYPPPPPQQQRDCGTGPQDPGCTMMRHGMLPMDGISWAGFYQAVRSQPNELVRQQTVSDVLRGQTLTALQLGLLMDVFSNELIRLDVVKVAAPRVVNPMHALGFSSKFQNSILGRDYVEVMTQQR